MSLQNSFYHIIAHDEASYTIRFDASHPIFSGHFPSQPIVPGACLVQIAQELLSDQLGQPVCFTAIRNLKFRQPVTPDIEITYTFTEGKCEIKDNADISYAQFATTYMCPDSNV
jgi:3-hydroxyacyl-[acyl-carrier-protein] dehydratase